MPIHHPLLQWLAQRLLFEDDVLLALAQARLQHHHIHAHDVSLDFQ